jgi:aminoglycoside phosphotransferase (APT) family kinase protein
VSRDGLPVAFIDWEYAGPMDPLVDLAECAWLNVQLHDDDVAALQGLGPPEQRARQLRLLLDGYGLPAAQRAGFVQLMIDVAVLDAAWEAIEAEVTPDSVDVRAWGVAWRARAASWMTRHRDLLDAAVTGPG